MTLRYEIAAALVILPSASWAADVEPICADRPGVATPTCTVPAGTVQVEASIADWTVDRSTGVRTDWLLVGAAALKYGVADRLHVELDLSPYTHVRVREGGIRESVSGFGDTVVAGKYRITGHSAPVQIAVKPFVKIPTSKRALGNGRVEGGLVVPISFALGESPVSVTVDPELDLNSDGDGSGYHLATAQVVSVGFPLAERLSASAELWGYWDFAPEGTVRQYGLSASAAYLLSSAVQVDAGTIIGLSRETPDVELYSGIAFRF